MHFRLILTATLTGLVKLQGTIFTNLLLLLPVEALRRFLAFSRPLSLSPSLVLVFSLPLSFVFSSSFRFVGDGALKSKSRCCYFEIIHAGAATQLVSLSINIFLAHHFVYKIIEIH